MSERPFRLWLFTLRLWQEAVEDGRFEWRGAVKNTASGETRYFRDWPALMALLPQMLDEAGPPAPAEPYSSKEDQKEDKDEAEAG